MLFVAFPRARSTFSSFVKESPRPRASSIRSCTESQILYPWSKSVREPRPPNCDWETFMLFGHKVCRDRHQSSTWKQPAQIHTRRETKAAKLCLIKGRTDTIDEQEHLQQFGMIWHRNKQKLLDSNDVLSECTDPACAYPEHIRQYELCG